MKALEINADRGGRNTFALEFPDSVFTRVLAGSAESVTVPTDAVFAVFSGTADFYVNASGTATDGTADSDSDLTELNPTVRVVRDVTTLSLNGTATVKVAFYK